MKTLLITLLGFCLASSLPAQGSADTPPSPRRTAAELDELLGPIALYPDALIALILPASTYPSDIVLGARYVATEGNPARVGEKSWDSSVKALTRYPDTLKWLDENLEWTAQLGDAFIAQPVEVMESIQQLRAKARALGNLVDTPQQRIVQDDTDIRIVPAQPNYIYEPRYDPEVVYYDRPLAGPLLFFGVGCGVGSWLDYDFDWHRHRLYRGEWHEGWDYSRDRNRRGQEDYYHINNNLTNSREWHPDSARHHAQTRQFSERASNAGSSVVRSQSRDPGANEPREHHAGIAHPKPIVGAPHRGETVRRADQRDAGKVGNQLSPQSVHENKPGDGSVTHVITPKSDAPGMSGEKKKHSGDGRDLKKSGNEPEHMTRRDDAPPRKEAGVKSHEDSPPGSSKRGPNNAEESKHKDAPKHEDAPKRQDMQKRDEPKHKDVPKQPDMVKRDAPKHEEAKPHVEAAKEKEKGKKGDKKRDDDQDKKKQ